MSRIDDALDGMSRRELEAIKERAEARLRSCAFDPDHSAVMVRATWKVNGANRIATLPICVPCLERIRLPEGRSEGTT